MATDVQTVIVPKRVASSRAEAEAIAERAVKRKMRSSRETADAYRFRQFPPERCRAGTYKTLDVGTEGAQIVVCEVRPG